MDSPGLLVGGLGEASDHRVSLGISLGGVSEADVYDAGSGRGGGESRQRLASAQRGGTFAAVER